MQNFCKYFLTTLLVVIVVVLIFCNKDHTYDFYQWMSLHKGVPFTKLSNKELSDVDIAFVGSSQTLYGIDPYYFDARHVQVLNAGVEGFNYPRFPSMLSHLYKLHPKIIVLSVDPSDLTSHAWHFNGPLWLRDIWFLARYNPSLLLDRKFYVHIGQTLWGRKDKEEDKEDKEDPYDLIDCSVYNSEEYVLRQKLFLADGFKHKHFCEETFGGMLLGKLDKAPNVTMVQERDVDPKKLAYLKGLVHDIDKRGIIPAVVLQGALGKEQVVDVQGLQRAIGDAFIIDMTKVVTKPDDYGLWQDVHHLNVKGRYYYTEALYNALKPVVYIIPYHAIFFKGPKRKGEVL